MIWSMFSVLFSAPVAFSAFPDPALVKLTYELRLQGKQICSGTQIVAADKLNEICIRHYNETSLKFRVKVKTEAGQYRVHGYITEHDKDGMPTTMSSPEIAAMKNERSEISITDENDLEYLGMAALVSPVH